MAALLLAAWALAVAWLLLLEDLELRKRVNPDVISFYPDIDHMFNVILYLRETGK